MNTTKEVTNCDLRSELAKIHIVEPTHDTTGYVVFVDCVGSNNINTKTNQRLSGWYAKHQPDIEWSFTSNLQEAEVYVTLDKALQLAHRALFAYDCLKVEIVPVMVHIAFCNISEN